MLGFFLIPLSFLRQVPQGGPTVCCERKNGCLAVLSAAKLAHLAQIGLKNVNLSGTGLNHVV